MFSKTCSLVFLLPAILAHPSPAPAPAPEWDGMTNLLVPNGDGKLEFATAAQLARRAKDKVMPGSVSLNKRDACSDQSFVASDFDACYQFCEHSVSEVLGDPQKVSADINCDIGDVCDVQHIDSITITEGFTITMGGTSPAGEEGNAVLSGSASFQWSKAETSTNAYTFHPKKGDKGYIVFRPKFRESRGLMQQYTYYETSDGFYSDCLTPVSSEDPDASGRSPIRLGDYADGEFTFCSPDTGVGC